MIKTRDDLKYYMEEDRKAYHKLEKQSLKDKIIEKLYPDTNYEFMKCLRKLEFQINRGG